MTSHKNVKGILAEAKVAGISYITLLEAIECKGLTGVAKMFYGQSAKKGTSNNLSNSTIKHLFETLTLHHENPNDEKFTINYKYAPRAIIKNDTLWDDFVKLIKISIPESEMQKWKTLEYKVLGRKAEKYGITRGTRNSKIIREELLPRMLEMYERRKKNFWENTNVEEDTTIDYKNLSFHTLRELAQNFGIDDFKITRRDVLIKKLENYELNGKTIAIQEKEIVPNYKKTKLIELKDLAKERDFEVYNNLKHPALVSLHEKYDLETQNNDLIEIDETENIANVDLDDEAKELEIIYKSDKYKYTNCCTLYMVYIGQKMVKIGYSDKILDREKKHTTHTSAYPQFRVIKAFEISSKKIEKIIHDCLEKQKIYYSKQKEIFKVPDTLSNMIKDVEQLLFNHDVQKKLNEALYKIELLQEQLLKTKDLEIENVKLKLKVQKLMNK